MRKALSLLFILLLPADVMAGDCTFKIAARYGISPILVEAVQKVESGNNPYAVNVQFYPSKKKAIKLFAGFLRRGKIEFYRSESVFSILPNNKQKAKMVTEEVKRNPAVRTYDVGLMQIDRFWIEKFNLDPAWLFDRCYNVKWGCYILSNLVNHYGYTWKAIWKYNGSRRYAKKVLSKVRLLCLKKYSNTEYCQEYFSRR